MKQETYRYYAGIFDRFSDERLFPQNLEFILKVVGRLERGDKVADVGGGTGYFTSKLLTLFPFVELTFIEPSPEMMALAKGRLPEATRFLERKLDDVLEELEPMDVFIFQRSLYCFYSRLDDYRALAARLFEKTAPGGRVAIYEFDSKYDLEGVRVYLMAKRSSFDLNEREFEESLRLFLEVLGEFNRSVDDGSFTLFRPGEIESVFNGAGFATLSQGDSSYFFKK